MNLAVRTETIIILFLLMGGSFLCRRTGVIGPADPLTEVRFDVIPVG